MVTYLPEAIQNRTIHSVVLAAGELMANEVLSKIVVNRHLTYSFTKLSENDS